MLLRRKTKTADDTSGATASEGQSRRAKDQNGLYLYVSDCSWRARFVSPEGEPIEKPVGEDLVLPVEGEKASIQKIIVHALDRIGKRTLAHVGFLTVVLDDPSIIFVENSALTAGFSSTNVSAIRKFGAEHVGVDEISYGFAHLNPTPPNEFSEPAKGGVYGFIEIARLRDYLNSFGALAPKLVAVTSAAHTVILGSAEKPDTSQCHIFMSAYSAIIAAYNVENSVAVIRSVPVGILSISGALTDAQGMSNDLALAELQRRDCIAPVSLGKPGDGGGELPNQFERILGPVVRRLGDEIDNTLSFFRDQRVGSVYPVGNIVVHGTADRIKGISAWLSRRLSLPVNSAASDCIEGVLGYPRADFLNLLSGAPGPLFKIGKVNWAWDKNKIRPFDEITEGARSGGEKSSEKSEAPLRRKNPPRRDSGRRDSGRRGAGQQGAGRAGSRGGRSSPEARTFFGLSLGTGANGDGNDRAGFGVMALLTILGLYGVYSVYFEPQLKIRSAAAQAFTQELTANAVLRREVEKLESGSHVRLNSGVTDKVLWTEKFLALGCYASESIWLTDVYLTSDSVRVGKNSEETRKLVIKGAVLPSYDGHLLKISEYIRRLEKDPRNLFMADFKTITFEGAFVDLEDVEEVVKFSIEAWYDSNREKGKSKRVQMTTQDLSMTGCVSGKEPAKRPEQKTSEGRR